MKLHTLALTYLIYFLLSVVYNLVITPAKGSLYVRFLDVGQGDAVLIKTPNSRFILVDGGPDFSVDYYLSEAFLFRKCRFDMVFLTHPHSDHYSGVQRLRKRCGIDFYHDNTSPNPSSHAKFMIDGVMIERLCPPNGYHSKDINDTSLVLLITYKNKRILLTGDAGGHILCRDDMLKKIGTVDIYKVSHHGSASGLCRLLIAKEAVISVGKNNPFGHPSFEVVNHLMESRTVIRRTDKEGTIEYKIL